MSTTHEAQAEPRLQGPWVAFKDTFARWKKHWRVFTGIQIIWAASLLLFLILGGVSAGFAIASSHAFPDNVTVQGPELVNALVNNPGTLAVILVAIAIFGALALIASTWMSLATVQAWDWVRKEEHDQMSVRRAYLAVWPLVPGYIWISILSLALLVLGFFGFVIPGILLALAFTLLSSVAVIEKLKGKEAIMRTTRLARPYLIPLFVRIVLTSAVLFVPGQIGRSIFNAVSHGLGDALYQMYGILVTPIIVGVLFATYREIRTKEKKEKYLVWLSLERMALLGALIAAALLMALVLVGKA